MQHILRPLGQWTDPETPPHRRAVSLFKTSWSETLKLLYREVDFVGGKGPVVIQVDISDRDLRLDGGLRANAKVGGFPGVVVSFDSQFGPLRYATDMFDQGSYQSKMRPWQHNVRAVALALGALRAVDRYGVSKRGEQYTGYVAIEAPKPMFADVEAAGSWMVKYATGELGMRRYRGDARRGYEFAGLESVV